MDSGFDLVVGFLLGCCNTSSIVHKKRGGLLEFTINVFLTVAILYLAVIAIGDKNDCKPHEYLL